MLVIRKPQMETLAGHCRLEFEQRMVAHVNRSWPERSKAMGPEAVRQSVREAVAQAAACGITAEYDVARFIDLRYALALDFDRSPRWPWAAKILGDSDLSGHDKVERLWRAAWYDLEARRIAHGG